MGIIIVVQENGERSRGKVFSSHRLSSLGESGSRDGIGSECCPLGCPGQGSPHPAAQIRWFLHQSERPRSFGAGYLKAQSPEYRR